LSCSPAWLDDPENQAFCHDNVIRLLARLLARAESICRIPASTCDVGAFDGGFDDGGDARLLSVWRRNQLDRCSYTRAAPLPLPLRFGLVFSSTIIDPR
jgi:hypothetical protein